MTHSDVQRAVKIEDGACLASMDHVLDCESAGGIKHGMPEVMT